MPGAEQPVPAEQVDSTKQPEPKESLNLKKPSEVTEVSADKRQEADKLSAEQRQQQAKLETQTREVEGSSKSEQTEQEPMDDWERCARITAKHMHPGLAKDLQTLLQLLPNYSSFQELPPGVYKVLERDDAQIRAYAAEKGIDQNRVDAIAPREPQGVCAFIERVFAIRGPMPPPPVTEPKLAASDEKGTKIPELQITDESVEQAAISFVRNVKDLEMSRTLTKPVPGGADLNLLKEAYKTKMNPELRQNLVNSLNKLLQEQNSSYEAADVGGELVIRKRTEKTNTETPSEPTPLKVPAADAPKITGTVDTQLSAEKLKEYQNTIFENLSECSRILATREEFYRVNSEGTRADMNSFSRWNPLNIRHRSELNAALVREEQALSEVRQVRAKYESQIAALRSQIQGTPSQTTLEEVAPKSLNLRKLIVDALKIADVSYEAVREHFREINSSIASLRETRYKERLNKFQRVGVEVYVAKGGDVLEQGVVTNRNGQFFIENAKEKWSIAVSDVATDDRGMPKIWLSTEINKTNIKEYDTASSAKDTGADFGRRKFDYLKAHATLSDADYQFLFGGNIRQSNVGNCYLVAAFISLQNNDHADAILRTSIRKTNNGYAVRVPLGTQGGTEVEVTIQDLNSTQVVAVGTGQKILGPLDAAPGWKLLEAAFTKMRSGNSTVDRQATTGGHSGVALKELLGGHGFQAVENSPKPQRTNMVGARAPLTDAEQREEYLKEDLSEKRAAVENVLNNFSNGKHLVHLSSKQHPGGDTQKYTVDNISLFHQHAYALTGVDAQNRTVTIVNPHNRDAPISMTYDQLIRAFRRVDVSTIDYNKMFT